MKLDISKKIKGKTSYIYKNFVKVERKIILGTNTSSDYYQTNEYVCYTFYKNISLLNI